MHHRLGSEANRDIEPVAGDEPARGRDDDGRCRIARIWGREQHAQRIALIEMGEPGDAVFVAEADFCHALAQKPRRCHAKQPQREIGPRLTLGNPYKSFLGYNQSWYPNVNVTRPSPVIVACSSLIALLASHPSSLSTSRRVNAAAAAAARISARE